MEHESERGYYVGDSWLLYNPETNEYIDTFDYEAAGLFSPDDCGDTDTPRLCCGCKFENECFPDAFI